MYRDEHNTQGAIVAVSRALRSDPNNAEAHRLLGIILGTDGRYAEAEPHLRRCVELLAQEAAQDPAKEYDLADARNTLAAVLLNLGRDEETIAVLQPVIGNYHFPDQHLPLANLGLAMLHQRRFQEAADVLDRAVVNRPDFCVGYYRLGEARYRLGDFGRALEALDRALDPRYTGCDRNQAAYRARGEVHARLHQLEAAQADFERCRDLDPRSQDGHECETQLRSLGASAPAPGGP